MKTASRILGTAFFRAGFEVQDAPRYGAERRGAPIYLRAALAAINERGIIGSPDLVVVADETLVAMPAAAVHRIYDLLGEKTVFINAAGCMTLLSVYPFTPFRGSWLYTAMASAPAGAQGVRDALDLLLENRRIAAEENLKVVVLTGDGAAYGMGLSATSGAIERGLDFIYIYYDNNTFAN